MGLSVAMLSSKLPKVIWLRGIPVMCCIVKFTKIKFYNAKFFDIFGDNVCEFFHRLTLAPILERQTVMTECEIIKAISKVEGIGVMTVNERLYVCGLIDEFDNALFNDKDKAKRILELLSVDKP